MSAMDTEKQLAQCLRVLEGKSDEHKFAGLLMITKLSQVTEERMRQVRREVVQIVGVGFFLRLLQTRGAEGNESLSSFQTLGLNLIASFCEDAEIADQFAQEHVVRFALDPIVLFGGAPMPSIHDCVRILQGLGMTHKGRTLLLQDAIVKRLLHAIREGTTGQADADQGKEEDVSTLEALWAIAEALSASSTFWTSLSTEDFEFLCSNFTTVRGRISLRVLAILNQYMKLVEENSATLELLSPQAKRDLRVGILQFLRAKWPNQERDDCLQLVHALMRQLGMSWVTPDTSKSSPSDMPNGKAVVFILKLTAIETKLMLDEAALALIQMEEKHVEEVEEQQRQERELDRVMRVLPITYGIAEVVIGGLVSENDDMMAFPYDVLLQIKETFTQFFTVVLEMLTLARDFMKTHRYNQLLSVEAPSVFQLDAVVYASVRVLSAWIAEDSDSCADQVVEILPFLVCYTPLKSHVGEAPSVTTTIEELDSDDEVDSDDEIDAITVGLQTASVENSIDQLHFLLPGLLQISATPDGAQVLADDIDVLRRILRFCGMLSGTIASGTEEIGGVPTLTLALGVLLNLLLLRNDTSFPHSSEWYRALSFLVPVACASGAHLMSETTLSDEERDEDDRYVMLLHVICVILQVVSHFQNPHKRPSRLAPAISKLVVPFNTIVRWVLTNPTSESSEATIDLVELCRGLSIRSPLTSAVFQ